MSQCDSFTKYVALGLVALSLQLVGCGGTTAGADEDLVPVAGTLKVDDKPVEGITLLFIPADNSATRGGWAKTDAQGNFKATHNATNKPGLPEGAYSVLYTKFAKPDGSPVPEGMMPADVGAIQTLPAAWSDMTKVGKHNQVTIPAGGAEALELKIDTKRKF